MLCVPLSFGGVREAVAVSSFFEPTCVSYLSFFAGQVLCIPSPLHARPLQNKGDAGGVPPSIGWLKASFVSFVATKRALHSLLFGRTKTEEYTVLHYQAHPLSLVLTYGYICCLVR